MPSIRRGDPPKFEMFIRRALPGIVLLLLICGLQGAAGPDKGGRRSRIEFDFSSLEKICLEPESVLADIDGFWRIDKAYWLTACWHKEVGYPAPPPGWEKAIKTFSSRPTQERKTLPILQQSASLLKNKDQFLAFALPLLASLLPRDGCDLSTTVFFTTAIVPRAFQKNFYIVLNIAAISPQNRENAIFNTIIHELFHVGYYRCECLMSEIPLASAEAYDLVYSLQNEGLATYAGYLAAEKYPDDHFRDYAKLNTPPDVRRAVSQVNSLMADAPAKPAETFRKTLFQVGVEQRALYVAGAFMAKTIDEKLGRQALASSMETGPRSFIPAYNSLVEDSLKVSEYNLPEPPTLCQRMRKAVVAEDYEKLIEILGVLRAGSVETIHAAGHILQNTGQLLLRRKKYELARNVYEVYKRFFPKHVNPYEGLGDACRQLGDRVNAIKNYEEVIKLAPGHVRVLEILSHLKK